MRLGDPQRTMRPIPATSHHQLTAIELQLGVPLWAGAPIQPCLSATKRHGGAVTGDVVLSIVLIVPGIILTLRARP